MTKDTIINKLPFYGKLESLFQQPVYLETGEELRMYNKINLAKRAFKILHKLKLILLIIVLLLFTGLIYNGENFFEMACYFGILVVLILLFYWIFEKYYLQLLENKYASSIKKRANAIAETINNKLNTNFYVLNEGFILFYNDFFCIYVDTKNSTAAAYKRNDIKQASLNQQFIKEETVKATIKKVPFNGYNYQNFRWYTNEYQDKVVRTTITVRPVYEWHLEIYSGFISKPYIKIIFDDCKDAEDNIKKAYALLL